MKKGKKARLLTMDELRARPCEVDGRPALFHRWIEEDRELLKVDYNVNPYERDAMLRRFRKDDVVPIGCSTEVIRNTFALVEYRDGTIAKVKPESIRFIGEEGQA